MKFSVTLPVRSRKSCPKLSPVRYFVAAETFNAYITGWSDAGYVITWAGPFSATICDNVNAPF